MTKERTDQSISEHRKTLDREDRLQLLEKDLVAALNEPTVTLDMTEVRKKGLLALLRGIRPSNSKPPTLH